MKQCYKLWFGVLLTLLVKGNFNAEAQRSSVNGRVVDAGTGKTIEYTAVLNYTRHLRIYSSSAGEFDLDAQVGDTLVLYAVGYYYQKIIVDATMINTQAPATFPLRQQAFEIAEVRIIGLGTYEEFKQQFLDLNQALTKTGKLAEHLAEVSRTEGKEAYDEALARGELKMPGAGIPILTPDEKERLVLAEIIKEEKIRDQIYMKYNPVVVKKITGLTDEDVIEFMIYCDFSDEYLLEVNEYDLMVSIARKFEMFKRKKQEEKSMQNRLYPDFNDFYPNA